MEVSSQQSAEEFGSWHLGCALMSPLPVFPAPFTLLLTIGAWKAFSEASVMPNTKKWHHGQRSGPRSRRSGKSSRHGWPSSGMKTNYWFAFWKN